MVDPRYPGLRPGDAEHINKVRREDKAAVEHLRALPQPEDVVEQLFKEAAAASLGVYRRWNRGRRGNEGPPKALIEMSKEARQLADRLYEILQARGTAAEAQEFLATLDARLAAAAPGLVESASPAALPVS